MERGGGFHKPTLRNFAPRGRLMVCGGSIEIMPDQTFVLVAEDEELVRLVIVQALLDEGFEGICSTRLNDIFPVEDGVDGVKRIDPPSCRRANDGSNAGK